MQKHSTLSVLGADVGQNTGLHGTFFRYPSYVQDIMGDIFSLGFGPFRYKALTLIYIYMCNI